MIILIKQKKQIKNLQYQGKIQEHPRIQELKKKTNALLKG